MECEDGQKQEQREIKNPYLEEMEDKLVYAEAGRSLQKMAVSGLEVIKNVLTGADIEDVHSSFNIVECASGSDGKKNEFELLDADDYDFEMKNFVQRFGEL